MEIDKAEGYIEYWVNMLGRAFSNASDKQLQKHDLTSSQCAILYQLWHQDGLTQKEIQKNLNLRAASVSGIVDILLEKKFIYREHDEKDSRFKRLYLTEKSKQLKSDIIQILVDTEEAISAGFSKNEKEILISWLRKLYDNIITLSK
jgi:DNA-binding MarR family transcriptional regulator